MIFSPSLVLNAVALVCLAASSVFDIKKREVPDWLSYFMIAMGGGIRLIFFAYNKDVFLLLNGAAGFVLMLGVSLLLFYLKQWGGGDSKILMGLGVLIGLDIKQVISGNIPLLGLFFINMLLAGAVLGLFYTIFLGINNFKRVRRSFKIILKKMQVQKIISVAGAGVLFAAAIFFRADFIGAFTASAAAMIIVFFYLSVFVKSVEKECLEKNVFPRELTEGDWLVNDIVIGGKYIAGTKDLGIEKAQIKKILKLEKQGKIKKVRIKNGMPFIPIFLAALILTLIFGNSYIALLGLF